MELIPYLAFNGDCAEAFDFYRAALGGEFVMRMTYGESPMHEQMPTETHGRIMHVHLQADGASLMGGDAPPGDPVGEGGTSVSIQIGTPEEAERIFNALIPGGRVEMPLQESFWSQRFGMLVDRYGKRWMVNCTRQP
jgi:PhnB protein